jgi:hypothetical protein
MAFRVPAFILPCAIWTGPKAGPGPRVVVLATMSPGQRVIVPVADPPGTFVDRCYSHFLLPKGTDVRGVTVAYSVGDALEFPQGSGRWYNVTWVEDVAKGFANEYRMAVAFQNLNVAFAPVWPQPTP